MIHALRRRPKSPRQILAFGAVALLLGACSSPAGGPYAHERRPAHYPNMIPKEKAPSTQWVSITGQGIFVDEEDSVDISNGVGVSIEGGWHFSDPGDFPRLSLEGGISAAEFDTNAPGPGDNDVAAMRLHVGVRAWLSDTEEGEEPSDWQPYVRGGAFLIGFEDEQNATSLEDGIGGYLGVGVDYEYEEGFSFGPYLNWQGGATDDFSELILGLGVTWHL